MPFGTSTEISENIGNINDMNDLMTRYCLKKYNYNV